MKKIAVLGAGNMGRAVVLGLVNTGYTPSAITVSNPHAEKLIPLAEEGVSTTTDNVECIAGADVIVLAVKPWLVAKVLEQIIPHITSPDTTVAVIAASLSVEELRGRLTLADGTQLPSYIVIPNTAMRVHQSATVAVEIWPGLVARSDIKDIFGALGQVFFLPEAKLPAATAIASCGIAYMMRYVRAAMQAGVQLGLTPGEAQQLAAATLAGAGELLMQSGAHPETEIDAVTTPGGLTIRGLNALDANSFSRAVIEAHLASAPAVK